MAKTMEGAVSFLPFTEEKCTGSTIPRAGCKSFISNSGRRSSGDSEGNWPTKCYVGGRGFPLFGRKLENLAKPVGDGF